MVAYRDAVRSLLRSSTNIFCAAWLWASVVAAAPSDELAAQALAKNEDIDVEVFADVALKRTTEGFTLTFSRPLGEGGRQRCEGRYLKKGSLARLTCKLEYISHSMGPSNRKVTAELERKYSEDGNVAGVSGRTESRSLKDNHVIERKKLKSVDDDGAGDFSKPMLTLSPDLMAAVPEEQVIKR